jgi:hypothetical protein
MSTSEFLYSDTVDRLKELNTNQILAVRSFIIELVDDERFISPLGINTEEKLWEHIDRSLSQAKSGLGRDADEVIDELMQKYVV